MPLLMFRAGRLMGIVENGNPWTSAARDPIAAFDLRISAGEFPTASMLGWWGRDADRMLSIFLVT